MLSLCAIVKNEQDSIEQMIASVRGLASQIVIVDTGSTDLTRERAAQAGAQVYHYTWRNDFADARNYSLSLASQPWILVLDADEALDQNSIKQLSELLAGPPSAYWLKRRHFCRNLSSVTGSAVPVDHAAAALGAGAFFTTHDIRLFPNLPEIQYHGIVHESVEESLAALGYQFIDTQIYIDHFGHLGSEERRQVKALMYLTLARTKLTQAPDDWRNWYQVGVESQAHGLHEAAVSSFRQSIALMPDYSAAWRNLGVSLYALGAVQEALECLSKALSFNSTCTITWNSLGSILIEERFLDEAEKCFQVTLVASPNNPFASESLKRIHKIRQQLTSA